MTMRKKGKVADTAETSSQSTLYRLKNGKDAAHLFSGWQETIIWSCLQNVMGTILVTEQAKPKAAVAALGDFCFFAGTPDPALVSQAPECCGRDYLLMIPQNDQWAALIEEYYAGSCKKVTRYALKKEKEGFDKKKLKDAVSDLPSGYTMKTVDRVLFQQCRELSWCRDFVSNYESYDAYQSRGLGTVILKDGEIVSGASSYSGYNGGIEIEIDTRADHRRKGLAFAAGARLILDCLEREWYPSWDAHNRDSLSLAEKLGYRFSHEYTAYEYKERE